MTDILACTPVIPARPGPACPAITGNGTDTRTAPFRLVANDAGSGRPGRLPPATEILAYFFNDDDPDDAVLAHELTLPRTDPDVALARQVAADPAATAELAALLRHRIAACPCPRALTTCPVLAPAALRTALWHAAISAALTPHGEEEPQ